MSKTRYQRNLAYVLKVAKRIEKQRKKGYTFKDFQRAAKKLLSYSEKPNA